MTYFFKVTVESIYTTRVRHVMLDHWLSTHHGSEIRGNGVRNGIRGSGVRGSPHANYAHVWTKVVFDFLLKAEYKFFFST